MRWFNEHWLHSHCRDRPPAEHEAEFYAAQRVAGVGNQYPEPPSNPPRFNRLFVYPVTVASGARLFPDDSPPFGRRLLDCQAFESGVVLLRYERNRPAIRT